MDISRILLDILIVLVAAKVAAEGAERVGVPAVVGEILAGIIVGPSLLGLVGRDDEVLRAVGEIGVILLLLDVGLEMDLAELRKVGRSSLSVATIGVVVPMVLGILVMQAIGSTFNTALFVGAALTATSVGITARVFGDLRALATSEARIVLGAAVADDVMGLVVLTVVVRLVTEGSVSVVSVVGIVAVAVAFLVVGGVVGLTAAPPLFRHLSRLSRSNGTVIALAFAFTLAFAELADAAKLAPIVGAFLAGLALGRTDQSDRLRSELAPVGHLFIPVFFLQIGIDAEVEAFGHVAVLRDAALLLVVAIVGKLVAALGARGTGSDRILIGLGMLPRGEVGLIFATIGLQAGVLGPDLYAALLLVVLATTLMTPPLLKHRSKRARAAARAAVADGASAVEPVPQIVDGEIRLPGRIRPHDALLFALRSALLVGRATPSDALLEWLSAMPAEPDAPAWSRDEREVLLDIVERGGSRSWRYLEVSGILDRWLPDLAEAMRRHRDDPLDLDLGGSYRWRSLERLRVLGAGTGVQVARQLDHPVRLLLGALLGEALDAEPDAPAIAARIVGHIGLDPVDAAEVVALVTDRHLLWAAARRTGALSEGPVRALASHLQTSERARATYVLAALEDESHERWERARLDQLHDLIQEVLADALLDRDRTDLVSLRRAEVGRLVGGDDQAVRRAIDAPAPFLLATGGAELAERVRLVDPVPPREGVRVRWEEQKGEDPRSLTVVTRDRIGMLAATAAALADAGFDIRRADLATWPDGAALESFSVVGEGSPDPSALESAIIGAYARPGPVGPLPDVHFAFDHRASPWHSVCEVDAAERPGLLADLATVFRAAEVTVRAATITNHEGQAFDTFELTTVDGAKLTTEHEERIRHLAHVGVDVRLRRRRRPLLVAAAAAG